MSFLAAESPVQHLVKWRERLPLIAVGTGSAPEYI